MNQDEPQFEPQDELPVISQDEYERELARLQSWYSDDNKTYYFGYKNVPLPSGLYDISFNQVNGFGLTKINFIRDDIYRLPDLPYDEIINDINNFWKNKPIFKKYNMIPKRGVIVYGHPGGGKTSLIYLLVEEIIKQDGIAIYFNDPQTWSDIAQLVRKIEKDRPILCIVEDIDLVIEKFGEQPFLTFLDGVNQIDNVLYIATTNHLEAIPDRIKNRPSRFDRRYEIKLPSKQDREFYLRHKILPEDIDKYDMGKMIADTEKFSMAQLKEFVISIFILGNNYNETIKRLKSSNINDQTSIGFVQTKS